MSWSWSVWLTVCQVADSGGRDLGVGSSHVHSAHGCGGPRLGGSVK